MELEEEVERLAPRLLRYCLGRLGDRGLAEEACQEALAALVERWRRLAARPRRPGCRLFTSSDHHAGRKP